MEEEMASAKAHGSVKDLFCVPELCGRTCAMLVVKYIVIYSPTQRQGWVHGVVFKEYRTLRPPGELRRPESWQAGSGG
jgi:hypothetical protein